MVCYKCDECDYSTDKLTSYQRHCKTLKHQKNMEKVEKNKTVNNQKHNTKGKEQMNRKKYKETLEDVDSEISENFDDLENSAEASTDENTFRRELYNPELLQAIQDLTNNIHQDLTDNAHSRKLDGSRPLMKRSDCPERFTGQNSKRKTTRAFINLAEFGEMIEEKIRDIHEIIWESDLPEDRKFKLIHCIVDLCVFEHINSTGPIVETKAS